MAVRKNYYVYVYIDPRSFEEFYYGKGRGARKNAHLVDPSDTIKTRRIAAIRKEGQEPIVRVIARGLSEGEALLVEKTLLWKLGKWTDNLASGHYADRFRPHNTLHKELSGFDYRNGIYYYNVGEGPHRNWDDYVRFGFISGGQGERWRDAIRGFRPGDVFVAYLKRHGFVGIGVIKTEAQRVRDVRIDGTPLLALPLRCRNMGDNKDNANRSEYVCLVDWIKSADRKNARWRSNPKLFTTTHIRASLDGQPSTVEFVGAAFGVSIRDLLRSQ
jgi:hypothetical protein